MRESHINSVTRGSFPLYVCVCSVL